MTTTTMVILTCRTTIQGVVGRNSDGCSLLSSTLLFVVTMWHGENTLRPKHGRKFVGYNWPWMTLPLEYIKRLSPLCGLHRWERRFLRANPIVNYISRWLWHVYKTKKNSCCRFTTQPSRWWCVKCTSRPAMQPDSFCILGTHPADPKLKDWKNFEASSVLQSTS